MWVFFLCLQAFADDCFHFKAKNNSFAIVKTLKTVITDIETLGFKYKIKKKKNHLLDPHTWHAPSGYKYHIASSDCHNHCLHST